MGVEQRFDRRPERATWCAPFQKRWEGTSRFMCLVRVAQRLTEAICRAHGRRIPERLAAVRETAAAVWQTGGAPSDRLVRGKGAGRVCAAEATRGEMNPPTRVHL